MIAFDLSRQKELDADSNVIQPIEFIGQSKNENGENLPELSTKAASSILDKFEKKISGKGVVRAGKGFTLFISNKDMDDVIKTVESLEKSGLLIDGATETVKHEIK